jgi:hypothetical protein
LIHDLRQDHAVFGSSCGSYRTGDHMVRIIHSDLAGIVELPGFTLIFASGSVGL